MHLLDLLRTPMAAPETSGLRLLRHFILLSSLLVAALVLLAQFIGFARVEGLLVSAGFSPASAGVAVVGARGAIAGLILAVIALAPIYLVRKNRADDAHLLALVGRGGES